MPGSKRALGTCPLPEDDYGACSFVRLLASNRSLSLWACCGSLSCPVPHDDRRTRAMEPAFILALGEHLCLGPQASLLANITQRGPPQSLHWVHIAPGDASCLSSLRLLPHTQLQLSDATGRHPHRLIAGQATSAAGDPVQLSVSLGCRENEGATSRRRAWLGLASMRHVACPSDPVWSLSLKTSPDHPL